MFNTTMARSVRVGEYRDGRILIVKAQHVFRGRLPTKHIDTKSEIGTIDGCRRINMLLFLIERDGTNNNRSFNV